MANECELANQCISACDPPVVPGIMGEAVLIVPYKDIDFSATTFNIAGEITALVLVATGNLFIWQGSDGSVKASAPGTAGEFVNRKYMHNVTVTGYGNSWAQKKKYMALQGSENVVFVRTKDHVIHVFGWDVGMHGLTTEWDALANDGTWQIAMGTKEPSFEPKLPRNFVGLTANAWAELEALAIAC